MQLCLELLDKILCYFYLPAESLPQFMDCMCKIMSVRQIADSTWKVSAVLLRVISTERFVRCVLAQMAFDLHEAYVAWCLG